MNDKEKESRRQNWAIAMSSAASEGYAFIVPDQPLEEVLCSGSVASTPAVRRQMAYQIGLLALGLLEQGAVEEATERCRQALMYDYSCEPAQACELAVLRQKGKRNFIDDRRDMESGSRDPFVIGLSYFPEKLAAQSHQDELRALAVMHIAGFFYWHAVKRHPDKASVLTNLGMALLDCNAFNAAQHALSSAVAIDPNDPHACHYLGNIYRMSQMFAEAITFFERSKRAHAEDGREAESLRGILAAIDSQKIAAFVDGGKKIDSPYNLAVALMMLGQYVRAIDVLSNRSVWREKPMAAHCFGQCLMMLGRFDEAIPKLQIAAETLLPSKILTVWCLLKVQKFSEVISYANEALRTVPLNAHSEFLYFAAEACRQLGNSTLEQTIVDQLFRWELWIREAKKIGL
jgi:tetratricopeptide (TPR) repeat protein